MVYVDRFYPVKTMSKDEFLKYYNEKYGSKPLKISLKMKTALVFLFANLIWIEKTMAKADLSKLNYAGNMMLDIVQEVAYWSALIMCGIKIVKTLLKGNSEGVGKIIIQALIAYGACHYLPFLFDLVKDVFAK